MPQPWRQPRGLAHQQRTDLPQAAGCLDDAAGTGAAGLLAGRQDELDAGPPPTVAGGLDGGNDHPGDAALHVGGATPEQPVAVGLAAEGVASPRRLAERHDVVGVSDPDPSHTEHLARLWDAPLYPSWQDALATYLADRQMRMANP